MRVETTYKYLLAPHLDFFSNKRRYADIAYHKRRVRRKGRHTANLDLRIEIKTVQEEIIKEQKELEAQYEAYYDYFVEDKYDDDILEEEYQRSENDYYDYELEDSFYTGYGDEFDFA